MSYTSELKKALTASSASGTALIPEDLEPMIRANLLELSPLTSMVPLVKADGNIHRVVRRTAHNTGAWFEGESSYSYTNLIMKNPKPPIEEPVRRDSKRKITLIELLDAFDHARTESEEFQLNEKLRLEEKQRLAEIAKKKMKGTAHEDFREEDIDTIWKKIKEYPKNIINFKNICEKSDPEERIRVFLSILFLAYENKIHIYQKRFPYGEIYIKTIGYT